MLESIIDSFTGLTPILWVSQIAGLIGLLIVAIAYQFDRKGFLIVAAIAYCFFIVEQVCAVLVANVIVTAASLIRNLWMFIWLTKKNKNLSKLQVASIIIGIWVALFIYMGITKTYDDWTNYLPPLMTTEFTILQNSKNDYVSKLGAFIHEGGFMVYYIIFALPFSALRQVILVSSVVISVIIMIVKSKKKNKELDNATSN